MSPTTGEHIDELEARRQRRESRPSASADDRKPPRGPHLGEAARDLLHGLITNGPRQGDETPDVPDPVAASSTQDVVDRSTSGPTATEAPKGETRREGVDELVRRVQAGAQTMAADAATAAQKRRPIGTADLSADAAGGHQPSRAARRGFRAHVVTTAKPPGRRRWTAAAVVLAAGIALVISLSRSTGPRFAATGRPSIASTQLSSASIEGFGGALRSAISFVDSELRSIALRATASTRLVRRKAKQPRSHSRRHVASRRNQTATQSGVPPAATTTSSRSQTDTQTQAPVTSSSQSSGTTQPSSSSSSQPAGPTNAGPLGGIGSCVKGC